MTPKLDDKPGHKYDSENSFMGDTVNSGYDQKNPAPKTKVTGSELNASILNGNLSALSAKEKNITSPIVKLSDTVGKGFSGITPGGRLARLGSIVSQNKKKSTGLVGGLIVIASVMFLAVFSGGPLKLVHLGTLLERFHFSNNLNFSDNRVSLMRFYRTGDARTLRLGKTFSDLSEKIDIDVQKNTGLRSVYSEGSKNFIGYEVVDEKKAKPFLDDLKSDGIDVDGRVPDGAFGVGSKNRLEPPFGSFVDLQDSRFSTRRSVTKTVVKGANLEKIPGSISSRLLIRYGGVDMSPLKNLRKKATDPVAEWTAKVRRERAERIDKDVEIDRPTRLGADTNGDDVVDEPDTATDTGRVAQEASEAIDSVEGFDPLDAESVNIKIGAQLNLTKKIAGGAVALVGAVCATRAIGNAIEAKQYLNLIVPMIRVSVMYMSIASQIKSGDKLSSEEISVYAQDLNDSVSGTDVFSAAPLATLTSTTNGVSGIDIPLEVKPSQAGEKPAFFQALDNTVISGICGVQGFVEGLPVIKQVGDVSNAAQNKILGAIGLSPDKLVESLVSVLAGTNINYYATGAELGNYIMYGGRLASNMLGASVGAAPLSEAEEEELVSYNNELIKEDNSKKSFYARMFDVNNVDSLFTRVALVAPSDYKSIPDFTKNLASGIMSFDFIPTNRALAAATFDYGIPKYDFSLNAQRNTLIQNPYENAEFVETNIERLNSEYGDCFNLKINPGTLDLEDNERDRMDTTNEKCHGDSGEILQYRVYLSDRVSESAVGCYKGIADDCGDVGFQNEPSAPQTTLNAQGLNGYAIPCEGESRPVVRINDPSSVRSDWTGIRDSGIIGTGSNGEPIKVYIREACNSANAKTVLIVSSIHGSENGGQLIGHELLFNAQLPDNVRIIVVPELNKSGILARHNGTGSARVNSNGVNLNRNADYRWSDMNNESESTTPGLPSENYRGESPASEPETKAITGFIESLGNIELSIHYHDDLNYVGPSDNDRGLASARIYSQISGMPLGNELGQIIRQKGSLDGWQASNSNGQVLIVELGANQNELIINRNVDAILGIINGASF
jgi:hypothetical protein